MRSPILLRRAADTGKILPGDAGRVDGGVAGDATAGGGEAVPLPPLPLPPGGGTAYARTPLRALVPVTKCRVPASVIPVHIIGHLQLRWRGGDASVAAVHGHPRDQALCSLLRGQSAMNEI